MGYQYSSYSSPTEFERKRRGEELLIGLLKKKLGLDKKPEKQRGGLRHYPKKPVVLSPIKELENEITGLSHKVFKKNREIECKNDLLEILKSDHSAVFWGIFGAFIFIAAPIAAGVLIGFGVVTGGFPIIGTVLAGLVGSVKGYLRVPKSFSDNDSRKAEIKKAEAVIGRLKKRVEEWGDSWDKHEERLKKLKSNDKQSRHNFAGKGKGLQTKGCQYQYLKPSAPFEEEEGSDPTQKGEELQIEGYQYPTPSAPEGEEEGSNQIQEVSDNTMTYR